MKREKKIVHIVVPDKFIGPYIKFIHENFPAEKHIFFSMGEFEPNYEKPSAGSVIYLKKKELLNFLISLIFAKMIIVHGLWHPKIDRFLNIIPGLLKKSHWVMWGGDYYFPEQHTSLHKKVIKKMGYVITYLPGDVEYIRTNYRCKGKYQECLAYTSNIFSEKESTSISKEKVQILVGNSADPTNNHINIFNKLKKISLKEQVIYCPLSYGDAQHGKFVQDAGTEMFGDSFIPMTKMISHKEYNAFLNGIDIAIFAHKRQQAMGNIISLLGSGKKVFIDSTTTTYRFLLGIGVKIFSIDDLDLVPLSGEDSQTNREIIKNYFSYNKLVDQWTNIFNS